MPVLTRFGVITDVHYADRNPNFGLTFRDGDDKVAEAVAAFDAAGVSFGIHLGDFIHHGSGFSEANALTDLAIIEAAWADLVADRYYVLGNHDLDTLTKAQFYANTGMTEGYYSFDSGGVHCVVLDPNYRSDDDDDHYGAGNFVWDDNFIPPGQRTWLEADLAGTALPTIVFIHHLLAGADDATPGHVVNNAAAVRTILEAAGNVIAVMQGHAHINSRQVIEGIPYYIFAAAAEEAYPINAFGIVTVYDNGIIVVDGTGEQASYSPCPHSGRYRLVGAGNWTSWFTGVVEGQQALPDLALGDYEAEIWAVGDSDGPAATRTFTVGGPRPDTPTVTVDQITASSARLTGSAYSHPESEDHAASQFRVLSAGGSVLYDSGEIGAVEQHTATGLPPDTPGLRPQVRYRDQPGEWSEWGEGDAFATLEAPVAPAFSVIVTGPTTAEATHLPDEDWVQVEYLLALFADTTYADPLPQSATKAGADRFSLSLSGLTAATQYRIQATVFSAAAGDWLDPVEVLFTTLAEVPEPVVQSRFTAPQFGEPIAGEETRLEWTLDVGRSVASIEISGDLGDTWDALASPDSEGVTFDSTAFADGFWIARLTLDNDDEIDHPGFLVDNADAATYVDDFAGVPITRWLRPSVPHYVLSSNCVAGNIGHIGAAQPASLGPLEPAEFTFHDGVLLTAERAAWITGAGILGTGPQAGEVLSLGIAAVATVDGVEMVSIRAQVEHLLLSSARARSDDPNDPLRNIAVGQGAVKLIVGPGAGFQGQNMWEEFSVSIPVAASWTRMDAFGITEFCRHRPYQFMLRISQPDSVNFPARYDITLRLVSPDHTSTSGRRATLIEEQVDLPETLGCGHLSFVDEKISGFQSGNSGRFTSRFSAIATEGTCGEPPPPPDPDEPVDEPWIPLPGRPCTLLYQHYERDRVTPAWEATTEAGYGGQTGQAVSYLRDPAQYGNFYGEQEIDPAEGRATIGHIMIQMPDRHQIPGDQDSGWMTERLVGDDGRPAIQGHRGRLLRFVGEAATPPWVVLADGPAGCPRMTS